MSRKAWGYRSIFDGTSKCNFYGYFVQALRNFGYHFPSFLQNYGTCFGENFANLEELQEILHNFRDDS